jgi:hypothetical protein
LAPPDRHAILQRFFEQRSLREIGLSLGVSEDATQKRIQRALARLRKILEPQGVTLSSVALGSLIGAHAVKAAPAGLALTASGAALATTSALTATTPTLLNVMNIKLLTAGAVVLTGIATLVLLPSEAEKEQTPSALKVEPTDSVLEIARSIPDRDSFLPLEDRPRANPMAIPARTNEISDMMDTNPADPAQASVVDAGGAEVDSPFSAPIRARVGSGQT